jgi:hypothetical protein
MNQKEKKMVTINLEISDLNRILNCLSEMKYNQVADLIENIRKQATPQITSSVKVSSDAGQLYQRD